jgi:hypothetical protein
LRWGCPAFALTAEPTGDGFTRGLNRLTGFVGWQAAGMILALIAWLSARALPKGDPAAMAGARAGMVGGAACRGSHPHRAQRMDRQPPATGDGHAGADGARGVIAAITTMGGEG